MPSGAVMDELRSMLLGELHEVLDRLTDLGGAVVFEDYPG